MSAIPDIVQFTTDPKLLGLSLSPAQETLLRTLYGLPLRNQEQDDLWRLCTERSPYKPGHRFREVTVLAGARSGKDSRLVAPVAVFEATLCGHERFLQKGEQGVLPCVAQDSRGAQIAFRYIRSYILGSPFLKGMLDGEPLADEIKLRNNLSIIVFPTTSRSLQGWSVPVGILDECAYWHQESLNADTEIELAVRRGTVQFPNHIILKVSTPYLRAGILHDDFKTYFGKDSDDVLVWRAPSALMNPSLSRDTLAQQARKTDPQQFARMFLAEFAADLEALLPEAWVDNAVMAGRYELAPQNHYLYRAAVDPSGGGSDRFALSIVHVEGSGERKIVVQDVCKSWEKPRDANMDLENVVRQIATIVKSYRVGTVLGDKYGAQWVREAFRRHGISYVDAEIRKQGEDEAVYLDKSLAYAEIEPLFAQGLIRILDDPRLVKELKLLQRHNRAGGKPLIDHPKGGHDDLSNALALAAARARQRSALPLSGALIPDGIMRLGKSRENLSGAVPQAGGIVGGQAVGVSRGQVGGQAAWVSRRYR